jgi:hypothetical protein
MYEDAPWRDRLRRDFAGWLKYRSVVPPRARNDIAAVVHRPERGVACLRRLCRERDQFRASASQLAPSVIEFDVVTDLDAEFAEITVEDRDVAAGSAAVFKIAPLWRNHQMNLAVDARDLALPSEQNRGIRRYVGATM